MHSRVDDPWFGSIGEVSILQTTVEDSLCRADLPQIAQPVNAALLCKSPQITERFQVARRAEEISTCCSQRLWMFCGDMRWSKLGLFLWAIL